MEKHKITTYLFLAAILLFTALPARAYAVDDGVSLTDLPAQLAIHLDIPVFAAQILTACIMLSIFLFPTLFLTKNIHAHLVMGITILTFCVAMSWIPYWTLLILTMLVALMFSGKMRDWITGVRGS